MKKVLIITYYWPPSGGSGVQRWLKFAKYLPSFGWQPIIYTPSNPEALAIDTSLEKDVLPDVEVIKRPISEPYAVYRRLTGKSAGGSGASANPINSSGKVSLTKRLSLWVRANFFVPDPRIFWVKPSVSYLKKYLASHPVDVIVSTGPPHSMHLIAQRLSNDLNIRWVADFRDPWTEIFYFKHLPMLPSVHRKHNRLQCSVLSDADAVVSVTDSFVDGFKRLLSDFRGDDKDLEKFHTVSNGFDEADFPDAFRSVAAPETSFCLTHTGLLTSDGNPIVLWKVLGDMCRKDKIFRNKLVIRLIGKTDREVLDSIKESGIEGNVINMGYLPHAEISSWQQKAWVLVLPIRQEPEAKAILTGKYFEYLAARRPIIAFGPTDGEMAVSLQMTNSGEIVDWDEEERLKKILEKHYNGYLSGNYSPAGKEDMIRQYSRKNLTEQMSKILCK